MARPRGAARGSASAIFGMPELAEKRTVTGTSCLKCNALLTLAASALGTNLPSRTTPLAWADRCVVCLPNAELSASTNVSGVVAIANSFHVFIAVLANQRDEFPSLQTIDLHLTPRPIREQQIALPGFKSSSHGLLQCGISIRPS